MSHSALLSTLSAVASLAHRSQIYDRFCVQRPGLFAQILVLPRHGCLMHVQADKEALGIDFRRESTRPDVPGDLRARPGYLLADELDGARDADERRVLFNGNNVGYWGNQCVIEQAALVYKSRGSIFDDEGRARHASGSHTFFCWSDDGFTIDDYSLSAEDDGSGVALFPAGRFTLPDAALSGYPLVRNGRVVWAEHRAGAWDPRLLYNVGRLTGVGRTEVEHDIAERTRAGESLVRHPLTAAGVDGQGDAVVLVVEQSHRSAGFSVAEAAEFLRWLGVVDAVALGAAGDAQLATTEEGFLTAPLVAEHVRHAARPLDQRHKSPYLARMEVAARPVPCLVSIGQRTDLPRTEAFAAVGLGGRHAAGPRKVMTAR